MAYPEIDPEEMANELARDNNRLQEENEQLRQRIAELEETCSELKTILSNVYKSDTKKEILNELRHVQGRLAEIERERINKLESDSEE